MFCSKCGNQMTDDSKFCPQCGMPVDYVLEPKTESVDSTFTKELNGVVIDLFDLASVYKLYQKRSDVINAAKALRHQTNCSLKEAISFISDIKKNNELMHAIKVHIAAQAKQFEIEEDRLKTTGQSYCPKCHSKNLHIDTKGYSLTKGLLGNFIAGPVGLIIGKHKSNKLRYKCMDCGHVWHD